MITSNDSHPSTAVIVPMSIIHDFRAISAAANLRALEGRPQNEVPEAKEKVVEGKPVGDDDGGYLIFDTDY
jgi:hypothetical protein